jgi:hypothetical protein
MNKYFKIAFCVVSFSMIGLMATADRGGFRKKRNSLSFNINMNGNLRSSLALNLRSGISYKGSSILSQQTTSFGTLENTLVTFKKGNTVYILPVKQKVLIPEYTSNGGYKLIIRR